MATTSTTEVEQITQALVELLRELPATRAAYICDTPEHLEFWVVTDSLSYEEEDPYYEVSANLIRQFGGRPLLRLVNPENFDPVVRFPDDILPPYVQQIDLSRP